MIDSNVMVGRLSALVDPDDESGEISDELEHMLDVAVAEFDVKDLLLTFAGYVATIARASHYGPAWVDLICEDSLWHEARICEEFYR